MNVRQADQACTEPRGTHARGSMSVGGGDRERDRAPVCPCRNVRTSSIISGCEQGEPRGWVEKTKTKQSRVVQ